MQGAADLIEVLKVLVKEHEGILNRGDVDGFFIAL